MAFSNVLIEKMKPATMASEGFFPKGRQ